MNIWDGERSQSSLISLLLSLFLAGCVVLLLWFFTQPVKAATCNVPAAYSTIQDAINDASCSTIVVSGGTYAGRISINRSLTIRGAGSTATVLDGSGVGRPVTIRGLSTVVRIESLRITNGVAIPAPNYGGGILVASGATLLGENLQIDQNVASTAIESGYGGGLAVLDGAAYLTRTLVLSNTALLSGTGSGYGGGLFIRGDDTGPDRAILQLTDSEVRGNVAYDSTISSVSSSLNASGGGLYAGPSDDTRIVLQNNTWERNVARRAGSLSGNGDGGAITVDAGNTGASVSITGDTFDGNMANATSNTASNNTARGGALFLTTTTPRGISARLNDLGMRGNVAKAGGGGVAAAQGGAIYARNTNMSFTSGTLTENVAGVANRGGQRAQGGAMALFNSSVRADQLVIQNNVALQGDGSDTAGSDSQGGGIVLSDVSDLFLTNSILADNDVSETGGNGAGVYVSGDSKAKLIFVTLADAELNTQEGVYADATGSANDVMLVNTMVVSHTIGIDNQGTNGRVYQENILFFGNTEQTRGPIIGDVIDFVEGDPDFLDPAGGSYRIGPSSAAINAGAQLRVLTDINGDARPQNGGFDIGADEVPEPINVSEVTIDGPESGPPGVYAFVGRVDPVFASEPIGYGWDNGDTGNLSIRNLNTGVYTLTITASNNGGAGSATISHTLTITPTGQECPVLLTGLSLAGPESGETRTAYTFDATITPFDATMPISYTWSPEPVNGQGTSSATYTWATAGIKPVAVTVQNCGGSQATNRTIDITQKPPERADAPIFFERFLPLIRR